MHLFKKLRYWKINCVCNVHVLLQSFAVIKKLLDNYGGCFFDSYTRHWVAIVAERRQQAVSKKGYALKCDW